MKLYGAAIDSAVRKCMEDAGLGYPVEKLDLVRGGTTETRSELGYRILTESTAKRYGYRDSPDPRVVEEREVMFERAGASYTAQFDNCSSRSIDVVPDLAGPGNVILALDAESREIASSDPNVQAASGRWRTCMVDAFPGLEIDGLPDDFASRYLSQELNNAAPVEPSEEEVAIAVQDVGCRGLTEFDQIYYEKVEDAQRRLITENRSELNDVRQEIERIQAAIDAFVEKDDVAVVRRP
ncbi:hypothetical protein [Myceligenerans xiligouense]|nr:hypothetical protein [Myceligenerans xiligouense]